MSEEIIKSCNEKMDKRIERLDADFAKLRSGRASSSIFDGVRVDYYGNPTPLNQIATLATPDARTITIAPFEKTLLAEIERTIQKAGLGLQPMNDGNILRVPIPPLNEERRKDLVKLVKKMGEDAKIAIRQARKGANDSVKKDKELTEDESKKLQGDIQKRTDEYIKTIDGKMAAKEKEILTI